MFLAKKDVYTERGEQQREVEEFTEEEKNQEVKLHKGCKASVAHLTDVTNVIWEHNNKG